MPGSSNDKSIYSSRFRKDRKFDTIPFRLNFVKDMIDGKNLDQMMIMKNISKTYIFNLLI